MVSPKNRKRRVGFRIPIKPACLLRVLTACLSAYAYSAGCAESDDFLAQVHSFTEARGLIFRGEYTGEAFGNLSGGLQRGAACEALLKLGIQLDLEKLVGWTGGSLAVSALYPFGEGLSREYTGDLNVLSNIDAYDSFRLFELWLQQTFLGGNASLRVGQMSADQEFYQSQRSNIFINSCFGTFPTISMGTNLPIYPVGGLGARLELHPDANTFVRVAGFDSNPGPANAGNKQGIRFDLNPGAGAIVIAEAGYRVVPSPANGGQDLTCTVGAYYDSRRFTGDFKTPTHSCNGGLYAIVDGLLYRTRPYANAQSNSPGLGAFASCAFAPVDRNEISFYADGGINYNGPFRGREQDVVGLALSYTRVSSDFLFNRARIQSGHETVLEATYRLQISPRVYLQPDFQCIFDPGAFRHLPNAVVGGIRCDLTF